MTLFKSTKQYNQFKQLYINFLDALAGVENNMYSNQFIHEASL